jgi:hypothetical protein
MFTNIFIFSISQPEKMIEPWSFLQKMRREKLYKFFINQSCWFVIVTFALAQLWTTYIVVLLFSRIKISGRRLVYNHTTWVELSKAHLSKKNLRFYRFPKSRYSQNKKVLSILVSIFVFSWELVVPYRLLILSNKQATIAGQQNWLMQFL